MSGIAICCSSIAVAIALGTGCNGTIASLGSETQLRAAILVDSHGGSVMAMTVPP